MEGALKREKRQHLRGSHELTVTNWQAQAVLSPSPAQLLDEEAGEEGEGGRGGVLAEETYMGAAGKHVCHSLHSDGQAG